MANARIPGMLETTRAGAIADYLDGEGIPYELVQHEPTMSAIADAHVTGRPAGQVAKTIVLHDGSAYVIAAIPASRRLDIHKLRELLGAPRQLRFATEDEIARAFPTMEVGAIPPFGPMVPAVEAIDSELLNQPRILCAAGDHRHSVLVAPHDIVRVTLAKTADIRQD